MTAADLASRSTAAAHTTAAPQPAPPCPAFERLAVLGCGLMGGSFALAAKAAGVVRQVVGYARSPATVQRARALGVIDVAAASAAQAVAGADLVLVAVPVAATGETLQAIRAEVPASALVMDVGSTKGDVVAAAQRHFHDRLPQFVPAHPIAGKERAGVEHASADLYRGCQVILTPLPQTDGAHIERARALWQALGARVRLMRPEDHDAAYAAVSHLPHLLAFAAVRALALQPSGATFLGLAGPGFRDFTRIAASDPDVWRDILLANAEQVLHQAHAFRAALDAFEAALRAHDGTALRTMIAEASQVRAQWGAGIHTAASPSFAPCIEPPSSTSRR
ncbi:prephenate dehydrogenase [Tepidimonas charontis]|uniref:Prephenate dehydrogenase n=1 Tax=Tepidimonas charontis TaxID=2267262 RepID=A0A554XH58_9BURK|nr:prephenate dehydrogenase/arogenate dehydrogenase family protein [Tepidimonas charontis]TSE35166.1 Prephenate dehydrogenase [Tepidimonas charontis]